MACTQRDGRRNLGGLIASCATWSEVAEGKGFAPRAEATGDEKSEAAIVPERPGNAGGGKGRRVLDFRRRETQTVHRNGESAGTKLQRIGELAKRDKKVAFTSLAHLLTPEFLKESFLKLNPHGAPGIDGETMAEFGANLEGNVEALWSEPCT